MKFRGDYILISYLYIKGNILEPFKLYNEIDVSIEHFFKPLENYIMIIINMLFYDF